MSKPIEPFNPWDGRIVALTNEIMSAKPVKNLTVDEVMTTLRLIQLKVAFNKDGDTIRYNDQRLKDCTDTDKFLAMLNEYDAAGYILSTRPLIQNFGGTKYHWRKIGRTCPITDVASAINECSAGYYGRGWIIAPHINRLRDWIIYNTDFATELR